MSRINKWILDDENEVDFEDAEAVNQTDGELNETIVTYEGNTSDVQSWTDFIASFVNGMKIGKFFKNLYAGIQYVLHVGSLVNNCVSDNPELPLAAAQGKVLMDEITQLKSDLSELVTYTVHSNTDDYFCESYQYSDGRMVINQRYLVSITLTSNDGTVYYCTVTLPTFPISFSAVPICLVFSYGSGGARNGWIWGQTLPSVTSAGQVYFGRGTAFTDGNVTFEIHSEGRWK